MPHNNALDRSRCSVIYSYVVALPKHTQTLSSRMRLGQLFPLCALNRSPVRYRPYSVFGIRHMLFLCVVGAAVCGTCTTWPGETQAVLGFIGIFLPPVAVALVIAFLPRPSFVRFVSCALGIGVFVLANYVNVSWALPPDVWTEYWFEIKTKTLPACIGAFVFGFIHLAGTQFIGKIMRNGT